MKKIFVIPVVLITSVLLLTTVARAEGGNPWDKVWAAIENLQNQINNIQLTPGPQGREGPAGANGVQGPQGEVGPAGPAGTSTGSGILKSNTYTNYSSIVPVPFGPSVEVKASCNDSNDILLSGGYWGDFDEKFVIFRNMKEVEGISPISSWIVRASETNSTPGGTPRNIQAQANCLSVD